MKKIKLVTLVILSSLFYCILIQQASAETEVTLDETTLEINIPHLVYYGKDADTAFLHFMPSSLENHLWIVKNCTTNKALFNMLFKSNGILEEVPSYDDGGFSDRDIWEINADDELVMRNEIYGVTISAITHKPIKKENDCTIVDSTQTNSGWHNIYKMCQDLSVQDQSTVFQTCNGNAPAVVEEDVCKIL